MFHYLDPHRYRYFWYMLRLSPTFLVGTTLPAIAGVAQPEVGQSLLPNSLTPASLPSQDIRDLKVAAVVTNHLTVSPESGTEIEYHPSGIADSGLLKETRNLSQVPTVPPPPVDRPIPTKIPSPPISPSQPTLEQPDGEENRNATGCPIPVGYPPNTEGTIEVSEFRFVLNPVNANDRDNEQLESSGSVFSRDQLHSFVKDFKSKRIFPSELLGAACRVNEEYKNKHYETSGSIVYIPKKTERDKIGVVEIRLIEGRLERKNVNVTVAGTAARRGLQPYIRSRLGIDKKKPLNLNKLQESLQLLQFDSPLIDSITARLSAGTELGESILDVEVKPSRPVNVGLTMDNSRVPSVGSMQRRALLRGINPLGLGDSLNVGYNNSKGSNSWDFSYAVPLTPRNTTLSLSYTRSKSSVIEAPFDDLDGDGRKGDIESSSQSYEISLRHPVMRQIKRPRPADDDLTGEAKTRDSTRAEKEEKRGSVFREVALGMTGSLRNSQTSLLDIPFPLSPGANEDGFTRISALRFFQEFTQQDAREVVFFRSQFNLGLKALGSTINEPIPGLNDGVPDSRFFSWLGTAQWTRRVGDNPQKSPLLTVRTNVQLADRSLVSSEQLSIGGVGTVRGYRQDIVQSDNGIFATAELQVPVARIGGQGGVFQVVPFIDYGKGWNSSGQKPSPNSLMSTGLGLRLQLKKFEARLDWGIPLISVASRGQTWQDSGIHFSLQWKGF